MEEPSESREKRPREKITPDTVIPPLPSKAERLPPPDEDKYKRELQIIEGKITRLRDKKKGVHDQIKVKKEGGKMDNQDLSVKEFIGTKVTSRKEMIANRAKLRDELDNLKHEFYSMVDEQKKIRPRIKIFDKEKTEKQIEVIQRKIETTTLTLSEEKKAIQELSELQQSVPLITQHATRAKKLDENKARQEVIKAQITAFNQEIDQTSNIINETNSKIKSSKDHLNTEIPAMFEETKKIATEIEMLEGEKKTLTDNFKEMKYAYNKQQSEIRQIEWMTKMKAKIIEQEERRKKEEEQLKLDELNKPHPYAKEITSCETYISYLDRFIPKDSSGTHKEYKEFNDPNLLIEKSVLNAKEAEEWFGATSKKEKKKKNKKQKKTEGLLANQPVDLLNFFSYCGIKVPTTVDEAKAAIEELNKRKSEWEAKDTRENVEEKKMEEANESKSADLSFNPVNFPAPEESKAKENYGIFEDKGPVPEVKEVTRGKRGKRRYKLS
ncbi:hypothetical protein SteCoe_22466 [Stentor coeruleus]|uniref:Uncharacterized protein n=1 Tax=Stentor coeruleus TaxID=5963 RepID=A0A1R2BMR5_9CILI|nr:hypothetical protein SteCoe_22466 [Stentor coeruleus]